MVHPVHPVFAAGKTALITGGASGVGFAVASLCRKHGMSLALVDNNATNLASALKTLPSSDKAKTETYQVDVSKASEWHDLRGKVEKDFGGVDFLMLNAGIGLSWDSAKWEDSEYWSKTLETNLFGVINGISTFLPVVKKGKGDTAIVMTGSKQGITNPPGNPAYNASKSAIKTIAEQLSYDLRSTSTSVHLLVPGYTYTGITGGPSGPNASGDKKPAGAWTRDQVAGFMEERMGQGKFYIVCPDNDVSEDTDKRRMMWSVGDVVQGRLPLSRWRDEYKEESVEGMKKMSVDWGRNH